MVQSFRSKRPATTRTITGAPVEEVPEWWLERGGSQPEYWVYRAIIRTGRLEEAGDFSFQSLTSLFAALIWALMSSQSIIITVQQVKGHTMR